MQIKTSASSNSRLSDANQLLLTAIRQHIRKHVLEGAGEPKKE